MANRIRPMIHVPNVRETAAWYESIGFELAGWHGCDSEAIGTGDPPPGADLDWALLRWGGDGVMLSSGGRRSEAHRRDVDLYIDLDPEAAQGGVDALFARLEGRVEIVEPPYDAFHGNRELILRDINGFWLTFAQPVASRGDVGPAPALQR